MNTPDGRSPPRGAGDAAYRGLFIVSVVVYAALFVGGIGYAVATKGRPPEVKAHALTDALERLERGDVARAAREYEMASRLDRTDEGLARRAAELRGSLGDQDWEVGFYARQRDQQPHNAAVHRNLAQALRNRRRFDEAVASYQRAIELQPNDPRAYAGIGDVLLDQDRLPEAEAAFREAVRCDPNDAAVYNGLGIVAALSGRPADAVTHFERAVGLQPSYQTNLDRARAELAAARARQ